MKKSINLGKTNEYGDKIHLGWSNAEDKPGQRTLWITEGKSFSDFYGRTISMPENIAEKLLHPDLLAKLNHDASRNESSVAVVNPASIHIGCEMCLANAGTDRRKSIPTTYPVFLCDECWPKSSLNPNHD